MRALGPLGFRITALTHDEHAFAIRSRYVDEVSLCPHPSDADAFTSHLLDAADRWHGALVLDTEDVYTEVLSRRKSELEPFLHLVAPRWEIARWFLEKDRTAALARATGVPHPVVRQPVTLAELDAITGDLPLPAMVKPVRSHEFAEAFDTKLFVCEDWPTVRRAFSRALDHGIEVIVQEVIPGTDDGTIESIELYVNHDGSLGPYQCNVKHRQSPPMFGVMRVGRSVPVIPDVRDHALALLRHVEYRGYASVEFKRDPRDGLPKLIEVNPRLPRNGALTVRSGTNFPLVIHRDLVEGIAGEQQPLRPAWFIDMAADVAVTLGRDRGALRRPYALLRPYLARRRSFALLAARDPAPALAWTRSKVRSVFGRRWGRLPASAVRRRNVRTRGRSVGGEEQHK